MTLKLQDLCEEGQSKQGKTVHSNKRVQANRLGSICRLRTNLEKLNSKGKIQPLIFRSLEHQPHHFKWGKCQGPSYEEPYHQGQKDSLGTDLEAALGTYCHT